MVLEELGLPFETKFLDFGSVKQEPYTSINPNGRVPAIEDPNTGLKLFESGAIIEYLIEQYDKSNKLSYNEIKEKYLTKCWLHFQMSGQGPYFGQKAWFTMFHAEKTPICHRAVRERDQARTRRSRCTPEEARNGLSDWKQVHLCRCCVGAMELVCAQN